MGLKHCLKRRGQGTIQKTEAAASAPCSPQSGSELWLRSVFAAFASKGTVQGTECTLQSPRPPTSGLRILRAQSNLRA